MKKNELEQNIINSISGSYNNVFIKLFINGSLENSVSNSGNITVPSSSMIFAIGANPAGSSVNSNYFPGKIYSVRLYEDVLTEEEILHNYNIDKIRFGI